MSVSLQDRVILVKLYYKNDDARVALQKFWTPKGIKKKGVGPMSVMGLKQMIQKFETIGSFD